MSVLWWSLVGFCRTPARWWSGLRVLRSGPSPWRASRATRRSGTWWTLCPSGRSPAPTERVRLETLSEKKRETRPSSAWPSSAEQLRRLGESLNGIVQILPTCCCYGNLENTMSTNALLDFFHCWPDHSWFLKPCVLSVRLPEPQSWEESLGLFSQHQWPQVHHCERWRVDLPHPPAEGVLRLATTPALPPGRQ